MNKLLKSISIVLVLSLLLSACGVTKAEKVTEEIENYFAENDYNACQKYISELDSDIKNEINSPALHLITNEFLELLSKNNLTLENTYDFDSISNEFTENCRKLWNVAKLLDIKADYNDYNNLVMLHYYGELSNYIKYQEIYELLEYAYKADYLQKATESLLKYEQSNDGSGFEYAYQLASKMNFSNFDPQEYLIEDFTELHNESLKALKSISNGVSTNNLSVIANGISDLNTVYSDILYIVDTVRMVHQQQEDILYTLSKEDIYKSFSHQINVNKREYDCYNGFDLDIIFGSVIIDDGISIDDETENVNQKIELSEALKIAVKSINKTKQYKKELSINYEQNRNIKLVAFDSEINKDLAELSKSQLNQALESTNGIGKKTCVFNNGFYEDLSLNEFIPPSNNDAFVNTEAIKEYNVIKGSNGYIISLTLYPEASSTKSQASGINSLMNGFVLEKSSNISDAKTSYTMATINLTVRNDGLLEKMQYSIKGMSECEFSNDADEKQFNASFSFEESYTYDFEY